jgi:hypothetical protein
MANFQIYPLRRGPSEQAELRPLHLALTWHLRLFRAQRFDDPKAVTRPFHIKRHSWFALVVHDSDNQRLLKLVV